MTLNPIRELPQLPAVLRWPWAALPRPVHERVLQRILNAACAPAIHEGELDFLKNRRLRVEVTDGELVFSITLTDGVLRVRVGDRPGDLTITGNVYAFMLLATRCEDADTLFFRRQLRTQGDTELGLYVKNFLDALDPDNIVFYPLLNALLRQGLRIADRWPR